MKNCFKLIARGSAAGAFFCFILSPLPAGSPLTLFNRLDLFTSASLRVPCNKMHSETPEDTVKLCSAGFTAGMRVSFKDADIRLYDTLPVTTFAGIAEISAPADFFAPAGTLRFGAALSFSRFLHFPLVIQTGMITPGGSFTRLSSPELSASVSPFTSSGSSKPGLSFSLPGTTSGEKPFAGAFSAGISEKNKRFSGSGVSCFYREDGTYAVSFLCCINFPRMMRTSFSATGGHFFLSNTSSSWFSDTNFFSPGWFSAICGQTVFSFPGFLSLLTVNAYEQPYSGMRYTFRSENKLSFGHFSLLIAGFAADGKDILCTSSTTLTTLNQLHITPQYTWRFISPRLPALTAGASCLVQRKYDKNTRHEYTDIKYTLGTQYADKYISARISFGAAGLSFLPGCIENNGKPEYTVLARFSETKGYFRPSLSASCAFSESAGEELFKISAVTQNKKISTTSSAAVSCRQKSNEYAGGTASFAFTCSRISKFLKYTGRFTISCTF
jgi:hypothetical protein